jgi:hypothetical protein
MAETGPAGHREIITIVSGVPRSGTSMMMRMLVAGGLVPLADDHRAPDESNPHGYFELRAVKNTAADASWVDLAGGKVVKVIHALLAHLPTDRPYRVVFMRRHLDEVIRSQNAMLRRSGHGDADLPAAKLTQVFEQQLRRTEEFLRTHDCFRVLDVHYQDVMRDPERAARAINAFFDGALDETAMTRAVDPALYRQRRP